MRPTRWLWQGFVAFAITTLTACGSAAKRGEVSDPGVPAGPPAPAQAGEVYGPFPGSPAAPPTPEGIAEPVASPDRIVLVFGPGLTHGYAYVGALRALRDLKIDVHAIYATEVGALAGALYYTQPNANRIDWAFLRFTEKNLQNPAGKFSFRIKSPENDLEAKLREVFGEKRLESLNGRLHVALEDTKTKEALEAHTGDLWRVLRGTLAGANGFSAIDLDGRPVRASARSISETYRIARQREGYPVVVVTAGDAPNELFRKLVFEQKGLVVHVPMGAIPNTDLKQRNQASFLGKSAVLRAAAEITQLVGRTPEAPR